jgi:integrase
VSVHKLTRGQRVRYSVRWREGRRQRSRSFDRRADAEAFDVEMRRRSQLGAFAPAEPSRELLRDWLRTWWTRDGVRWEPSTRSRRASVLDLWIVPYLGDVRLRDLGSARIRDWRAQIVERGCPPTQTNHALSILSAALGAAARDGLLPFNPALRIGKLPVAVRRPKALAPMEVELIRANVSEPRDVVLVGLLCYAGLRPEEALALTWGSVGRVLVIDRAFTEGHVKLTKTHGRRTVEIIAPLAEDLEHLRPSDVKPDDLVVPGARGGLLDLRNWRRRVWHPACEAAGVRAVPYDGRHTYASLLIHEGRSIAFVAASMGHASATTTLRHYGHMFDESRLGTSASMVDAIRAARGELGEQGCSPVVRQSRDGVADELADGDAQLALFQDPSRDGRYWARTSDPQLVELVLSQLS